MNGLLSVEAYVRALSYSFSPEPSKSDENGRLNTGKGEESAEARAAGKGGENARPDRAIDIDITQRRKA